jgi:hypothetical protein
VARAWFEKAANGGFPRAMANLGRSTVSGISTKEAAEFQRISFKRVDGTIRLRRRDLLKPWSTLEMMPGLPAGGSLKAGTTCAC